MANIKISPKYGLNPTIPICFWCGKEKNEIALLGRISKREKTTTAWGGNSLKTVDNDAEAPKNAIIDYNPCEECAEKMAKGCTLIGVTTTPIAKDLPPIGKDDQGAELYPTSRYMVVKDEGIRGIFVPEAAEIILKDRKTLFPDKILVQLMDDGKKSAEKGADNEPVS